MHAIVVSLGTDGDVFPFIAVGARLRARGHRVTLAANENFQHLAERHGLEFHTLVTNKETDRLLGNPDVWHPYRSGPLGCQWAGPLIEKQYGIIQALAGSPEAVLVAYPPVFAARLVHEKLGTPLASLVAIPWLMLSVYAPPRLPHGLNLPRWAPRFLVRPYWRLLEGVGDHYAGPCLNRVRNALGQAPVKRIVRWSFSAQLTIALFPDWYAPPQPDWPTNTKLAGFSLFDGGTKEPLPQELEKFISAGPAPIAFTFGSGNRHSAQLFRTSIKACEILGVRGILVTKFPDQPPAHLPASIHHCAFAPFRQLFPRCAAVVHHGGLGTTAQALAARVPQIILPLAWDQFDNASRVQRLGAGLWLKPRQKDGSTLAAALAQSLTPQAREKPKELAQRFHESDSLEKAADLIEAFAAC